MIPARARSRMRLPILPPYTPNIRSTAAAMKTTISASSWGKVSAFLYYVAIVVSTFFVPLAGVEYISWSEIYKYVGVSIVVGHYCELNSHMTGLIYVLLTNRISKLRITLSIRLASEIIILLIMSALPVMPASVAGL